MIDRNSKDEMKNKKGKNIAEEYFILAEKYNELNEKYNSLVDRYNGQAIFLKRRCTENHNLVKEIAELKAQIEKMKCCENQPKWHKVADGDYPPYEKGNYTINVFTDSGEIAYYNYDFDCWIAEPASAEIDPPIAWCELPKYTKE